MVYFFTASVSADDDEFGLAEPEKHTIYMGKDKFENDPLIHKSHPKNLWFHVDKHSSAHLYLQLSPEQQNVKFEDLRLSELLLDQIAQLTKANLIKANKLNNISIIYTPVDNLRSDGLLDTGTVTFVNPQKLRRVHVVKKDNAIINRLNKTKTEISTEQFVKDQDQLLVEWQRSKKDEERRLEQKNKAEARERNEQKKFNKDPYGELFTEEALRGSSNEFRKENWVEDEFW
ncbi:hypothetical protein PUMCH_003030 [Australozyma saopauloensis]|uniref:NFACT RNA-binding domain-containing protein n=1 Tax=Australozyma saopauloensis TaxID=291208 RepID=A0AAX4HAZ0_9ASCO|nr:hypothetical protein PUMCH_003030 [[Candida] saopauloensis]